MRKKKKANNIFNFFEVFLICINFLLCIYVLQYEMFKFQYCGEYQFSEKLHGKILLIFCKDYHA